jgi:hypothetical protein
MSFLFWMHLRCCIHAALLLTDCLTADLTDTARMRRHTDRGAPTPAARPAGRPALLLLPLLLLHGRTRQTMGRYALPSTLPQGLVAATCRRNVAQP